MAKVNPLAIFREEFDNSALLFNPESGEIFALNPTGRVIWQALSEGLDRAAMLERLAEKCRKPLPTEAEKDLDEFLSALKAKGFLADE